MKKLFGRFLVSAVVLLLVMIPIMPALVALAASSVITNAAGAAVATTATMNKDGVTGGVFSGNVTLDGSGMTANVCFQYGLTTGYGSSTANWTATTNGTYTQAIPASLIPGNLYHYRAVLNGTTVGDDANFTLTMPIISTGGASQSGLTAVLSETVSSMGSANTTYVSFQWGYDTSYGSTTTPATASGIGTYTTTLSGYDPSRAIHYMAKVTNGVVSSYGSDASFTQSTGASSSYNISLLLPLLLLGAGIFVVLEVMFGGGSMLWILVMAVVAIYLIFGLLSGLNGMIRSIWGG